MTPILISGGLLYSSFLSVVSLYFFQLSELDLCFPNSAQLQSSAWVILNVPSGSNQEGLGPSLLIFLLSGISVLLVPIIQSPEMFVSYVLSTFLIDYSRKTDLFPNIPSCIKVLNLHQQKWGSAFSVCCLNDFVFMFSFPFSIQTWDACPYLFLTIA